MSETGNKIGYERGAGLMKREQKTDFETIALAR
jgi:hypothetical protein